MDMLENRAANHAAYRRMRDVLAQIYRPGQFVAFFDGQIAADGDNLTRLRDHLTASGKDPVQVLIVQVGVEYPENAFLFPLDVVA